jgi:5'(3')-deoxyribonucleotidase
MKFVLDLDSTLLELPVLEEACNRLGMPGRYTMKDARDWCFTDIDPDVRGMVYRLFSDPWFMLNLPSVDGAEDFVAALVAHKHDVWIVSCRSEELWADSHRIIKERFPGTTSVMLRADQSKMRTYLDLKPDIVIDDSPANVAAAMMAGVPRVIMCHGPNTPYNTCMIGARGLEVRNMAELCRMAIHN